MALFLDKKPSLLHYECFSILEKSIRDQYVGLPQSALISIIQARLTALKYASDEQLKNIIDDYKKPEPYKHTLFFLVIYLKSLELDPEWLSTMYITTLAIEKQNKIKKEMQEIEDLKTEHENKFGSLINKIINYLC